MKANKPMTGEQLDELMTVAVNMQRDAETDCKRPSAMFAYAVQVAVLELRKVRNDAEALAAENAGLKAAAQFGVVKKEGVFSGDDSVFMGTREGIVHWKLKPQLQTLSWLKYGRRVLKRSLQSLKRAEGIMNMLRLPTHMPT